MAGSVRCIRPVRIEQRAGRTYVNRLRALATFRASNYVGASRATVRRQQLGIGAIAYNACPFALSIDDT